MKWLNLPPKGSLQRRLSLALAIGVTVLWLAGTLAAGLILRGKVDEMFDSALQEVAQRVLPIAYIELLNSDAPSSADTPPLRVPAVGPRKEYITYIVHDAKGRVLLHSHDANPAAFPDELQPGFHDTPQLRLYTERAVQGTFFVTASEFRDNRHAAVVQAFWMLVWPLAVFLPVSLFGIWALVGYALRPVLDLQAEIEARGRGNLSPIAALALPAEMGPLAAAVNRLLIRLRRTLEAERSFTANSAHELRTPIAAALAQTQRLLTVVPNGPPHEHARTIETALRQLSRLSEKLLQLARAEGGGLLSETPQDLAQVLRLVLDDFGHDPVLAKRLDVALPLERSLWCQIDPDAFAILARNLVENALRHSPVESIVRIQLTTDFRFSVANKCPIVPPEVLAQLTRPFERGVTLAEGSGLGLAIAETIATGVGARLELLSPIPGHFDGFEARVHLPAPNSPVTKSSLTVSGTTAMKRIAVSTSAIIASAGATPRAPVPRPRSKR